MEKHFHISRKNCDHRPIFLLQYDDLVEDGGVQERLNRFSREEATKVLAVLPSWKDQWRYFYLTAAEAYGFRAFKPGEPLLT